jgi:hypothetical protein
MLRGRERARMVEDMRAKTLFWLLIVAAIAAGVYLYAWPRVQGESQRDHDFGPRKVVIQMPSPGG